MLNSMGFRNSGKLNLSGKQKEYAVAGGLLVVIVAVLVFVGTQVLRCDSGAIVEPGENRVKCTKCGAEWAIKPDEMEPYSREVAMGGVPVGADCDKCDGKNSVFLMRRCPECMKYYLSKRITDPSQEGVGEICPHCNTDLVEWYKEKRKRR